VRRRGVIAAAAALAATVAVVLALVANREHSRSRPGRGKLSVIEGGDAGRSARFHVKDRRLFFPAGARRPSLELSEYEFAHWSDGHRYAVVYKSGDTRGTLYDRNGSEVARIKTSKPRQIIAVSDEGQQLYCRWHVEGEQPPTDVELFSRDGRLLFKGGSFKADNVCAQFLSEQKVLVTHTVSRGEGQSAFMIGEAVCFDSEGREVWKREFPNLRIERAVISKQGMYVGFVLRDKDRALDSIRFFSYEGEPVWSHSFWESLEGRGWTGCIWVAASADGDRVAVFWGNFACVLDVAQRRLLWETKALSPSAADYNEIRWAEDVDLMTSDLLVLCARVTLQGGGYDDPCRLAVAVVDLNSPKPQWYVHDRDEIPGAIGYGPLFLDRSQNIIHVVGNSSEFSLRYKE